MGATTLDRNTPALGQPGRLFRLAIANAADVPAGVLVGVTDTGATNASDAAGLRVAGRSVARATQTAGDTHVIAQAGVYAFAASAALIAAAAANLFKDVYVVDNQTVGVAADTVNNIVAGKLVQISDGKYFVAVGPGL